MPNMRRSFWGKHIHSAAVIAIAALLGGCSNRQPDMIEVGNNIKGLSSTQELSQIKYRLVDLSEADH
jgi:hypothetical protein